MPFRANCVTCGAVTYELAPTDEPECIACTEKRDPEEAERMKQEHLDFAAAIAGLPEGTWSASSDRPRVLN